MMSVSNIADDVLDAIGGAKSPGRDRWYELKQLLEKPKNLDRIRTILSETDLSGLDGDARFAFVKDALSRKAAKNVYREPEKSKWTPADKAVSADIRHDGKSYTLALKAKDAVGFGEFIAANLDDLYAAFRKNLDHNRGN